MGLEWGWAEWAVREGREGGDGVEMTGGGVSCSG